MNLAIAPAAEAAAPGALAAPVAPFDHIFDFPSIHAGEQFTIDQGSTVGSFHVHGTALLSAFTPTSAQLHIKAGAFGINREADVGVSQTSPTTAGVTIQQTGKQAQTGAATIVAVRPGYAEFHPSDPAQGSADVVLQTDAQGHFLLDAVEPGGDRIHLVLSAAAPALVSA